jgi:hypothetical protein
VLNDPFFFEALMTPSIPIPPPGPAFLFCRKAGKDQQDF